MQLIVLAAGKGSRLPKQFRSRPKCLVKINSKPLLLYNKKFYDYFKNKIIITGYKENLLKNFTKKIGFKDITNKEYSTTNMVYSLFLAAKKVNQDVVIVYGDIIFKDNILKLLKQKRNILPVNVNWLKNWTNRMPLKKVLLDAENLRVKKGKLLEIGNKINIKKYPKYQFMGIIKLSKNSYFKCFRYFKKIKNNKIDMTSFINLCVRNKIISIKVEKYKNYWYEIDTVSDYKYTKNDLKK